jgi:hypothetical protein
MEEQKPAAGGLDVKSIYRRAGELSENAIKVVEKYRLYSLIGGEKYLRLESLQAIMVLAWIPGEFEAQTQPQGSVAKKPEKRGDGAQSIRTRLFAILGVIEKDNRKARALFTALTGEEKSGDVDDKMIESLTGVLYKVKDGSAEIEVSGTYVWIKDRPTGTVLFGKIPPAPAKEEPKKSEPAKDEPPGEMEPF